MSDDEHAPAPLLQVEDLRVALPFPGGEEPVEVVRGVSFRIPEGGFHALVGESGCGKSVSAMALTRLPPASDGRVTGRVLFRGRDLLSLSPRELREARREGGVAYVFQDPMTALNPVLTLGTQLREAAPRAMPREAREEMLRGLLAEVGLPDADRILRAHPCELSGGMAQRACLAMAMAQRPALLVADEPTTALDVTIQAQILELMKDLQKKKNTSIIFITHNLGVVAEICDRVSVMYAGHIVEQGPVNEIFYNPQHPYTKGLLASTPRLDEEGRERLVPIEGPPIDLLNPPQGCNFGPRCKDCMKICLRQKPPFVRVGDGHISACWLHFREQPGKGDAT